MISLLVGKIRINELSYPKVRDPKRAHRKRKKKMYVEIRAAEGGDDAKMLVEEQTEIYAKVCNRRSI